MLANSVGYSGGMTTRDAAVDSIRAALREIAEAREREAAAVVAALRAGLGPVEIGVLLGRSREFVRKIARAND